MENKQQELPHVGCIIPCHNHAQYVQQAMKSMVEQDYPNKTLVVVDDGSSDGSFDKAKELLTEVNKEGENLIGGLIGKADTVIIRNEEPSGPSQARNKGIQLVRGVSHMIAPLDADDLYLPGKLSKSVGLMLTDPMRIGIIYTDVLIYNEMNKTYTHEYRRPYSRDVLERENIISNAPLLNLLALDKTGLYYEGLRTSEDWDLWLRITENFVALHIPEPLQVYRVTGQNATNIVNKEQWQRDWQTVYYRMQQRKGV